MTKSEIRKEIKKLIVGQTSEELQKQSSAICQQILNSKDYAACNILLAYMALPDEVEISPVIQDALSKNKSIYLPRIIPGSNQMDFYRYEAGFQTSKGSFGIREPEADEKNNLFCLFKLKKEADSKDHHSTNLKTLHQILVLVPGRAFTKNGKRLGRGKGFYDIYFSRLEKELSTMSDMSENFKIKKSGVCFSCQLLTDLPTTPDDILMDSLYCPSI